MKPNYKKATKGEAPNSVAEKPQQEQQQSGRDPVLEAIKRAQQQIQQFQL